MNEGAWEFSHDFNLNAPDFLSDERKQRLMELIAEALLTKSSQEWEDIFAKAKVAATAVRTREQWLALEALQKSGVLIQMKNGASRLTVPGRLADVSGPGDALQTDIFDEPKAITFSLATELFNDRVSLRESNDADETVSPLKKGDLLRGLKVLDLSNMVAGPLGATTLAEYGAEVIKADPSNCPSPVAISGGSLLHGKRSLVMDVTTAPGRQLFERLLSQTDVVMHNVLDGTAKRLGVSHPQLQAINSNIVSCQISAFGGSHRGGWEKRLGFDNLLQGASGLMAQFGSLEAPQDHGGIACTDIPGGIHLAFSALLAVYQRHRTGHSGEGRVSLARAANYYQLPYMIADENGRSHWGEPSGQFALGEHVWQHLYECCDGWIYVGTCEDRMEELVEMVTGLRYADSKTLQGAFAKQNCSHWQSRFDAVGIGCHRVLNVEDIHTKYTRVVDCKEADEVARASSEILHWENYPPGFSFKAIAPNIARVGEHHSWKRLSVVPYVGEHTAQILAELGYSEGEIAELIEIGAAHEYLPVLGKKQVYAFKPENLNEYK